MEGKTRNEQHLINESCSSVKMCGKKHGNVIKTIMKKITQITNINNITIFIGSLNPSQIGGGFLFHIHTTVFHDAGTPGTHSRWNLQIVRCVSYVIRMFFYDQ